MRPAAPSPLSVPVTAAQSSSSPASARALIVPGGQPTAGSSRRYVLDVPIAFNGLVGITPDNPTATVRMSLPSSRLHNKLTIGFSAPKAPGSIVLPQTVDTWTWELREFALTDRGLVVPGNEVFTGTVLPASWETVTLSRQWLATVTIPSTHGGGTPGTGLAFAGQLVAVAEWEPAAGESPIPDDELALLFNACTLAVERSAQVFSGES